MRLDDVRQDLRSAVRSLLKSSTFTAIAVSTMAVGIGAAVGIFTVVNTVLLNGIKAQTGTDTAFKEFFLYDLKGQIIASSDATQVGKIVGRQPYFKPSLTGNYLQTPYYDVSNTDLTMFITRPLTSTAGDVIGVIAGRLDLSHDLLIDLNQSTVGAPAQDQRGSERAPGSGASRRRQAFFVILCVGI